jgi:hypothetical protein
MFTINFMQSTKFEKQNSSYNKAQLSAYKMQITGKQKIDWTINKILINFRGKRKGCYRKRLFPSSKIDTLSFSLTIGLSCGLPRENG